MAKQMDKTNGAKTPAQSKASQKPDDAPKKKRGRPPKKVPETPSNTPENVFFYHFQKINAALAERDKINEQLKKLRAKAKSAGIDTDALSLAQKIAKQREDERFYGFRNLDQYLKYMQVPTGTQLGMFQEEMPDQQDPREVGLLAGKMGDDRDSNPFSDGDPAWHQFDEGWLEGQKFIADSLAPKDESVNADDEPSTATNQTDQETAASAA